MLTLYQAILFYFQIIIKISGFSGNFCSVLHRISIEGEGGKPWVSDFSDPNYIAGRKAMTTGINVPSNDQTIGFSEENMIVIVHIEINELRFESMNPIYV